MRQKRQGKDKYTAITKIGSGVVNSINNSKK